MYKMNVSSEVAAEVELLGSLEKHEIGQRAWTHLRSPSVLGREALRQYIDAQPVQYESSQGAGAPLGRYDFRLPHNSHNSLLIDRHGDEAKLLSINVCFPMRRMGIAKRLYQAAFAELQSLGVRAVSSHSISSQALATRAAVFGEDSMRFYEEKHPDDELPIAYQEAVTLTAAIETKRDGGFINYNTTNLAAYSSLNHAINPEWERPRLTTTYQSSYTGERQNTVQ